MLRLLLLALLLTILAGGVLLFTADRLLLFNRLVPKDPGTSLLARDVAFGPRFRQRLDIYGPAGTAPGARLPVIVFIHGGGWSSGDKAGYEFAGRALAARGFVAVLPNYRLVPDAHFPDFVDDAAAAVRWVRAHIGEHGGDGERIVLAGHSAGAHIAALLAMDERRLGADRAAIRGWAGLAGPYDFLPLDTPATIGAFGDVADLRTTQPIAFASPGDPPALLLHGEADETVKPRQSDRLAARLIDAGVPVELRRYLGIGHVRIVTALSRWTRGSSPALADLTDFARRMTRDSVTFAD